VGSIACVLAAAALVVGIIGLKDGGDELGRDGSMPSQSQSPTVEVFVDGKDRELCQAMSPLMSESNNSSNALHALAQNTPERKAAIPKYVSDTYAWARRAQDVLNRHLDPPRFLTQNFQAFIYHNVLFAEGLAPDRDSSAYENEIYEYSIKDLAGLIGRCSDLDIRWWK
jgi:hypothetical protein